MLSNRSHSGSRSKPQKNRQRGINLISNTLAVKPSQMVKNGTVQVFNHSKSKSFSLLEKEQLKGIKYRTGVINQVGTTYQKGTEIQWHSTKNSQNQLKTCRNTYEINGEQAQMNKNSDAEKGVHARVCGSGNMQIQQIILRSAYFKVRQKEKPRLKIELKRF